MDFENKVFTYAYLNQYLMLYFKCQEREVGNFRKSLTVIQDSGMPAVFKSDKVRGDCRLLKSVRRQGTGRCQPT